MTSTIIAFVVLDLVVTVAVVLWILRRRQARQQAQGTAATGRPLTTTEALAAARGEAVPGRGASADFGNRLGLLVAGQASPLDSVATAAIERAVRNGEYIEAIKGVRQATGLGLKEAKDVVDRLAAEFRG